MCPLLWLNYLPGHHFPGTLSMFRQSYCTFNLARNVGQYLLLRRPEPDTINTDGIILETFQQSNANLKGSYIIEPYCLVTDRPMDGFTSNLSTVLFYSHKVTRIELKFLMKMFIPPPWDTTWRKGSSLGAWITDVGSSLCNWVGWISDNLWTYTFWGEQCCILETHMCYQLL